MVANRASIESLYDGKAVIITYEQTVDEATGIAKSTERRSSPYPCRLSYKTLATASSGEGMAEYAQAVTLFIAPEIVIPAGADIDVSHRGRDLSFTAAGVAAVYDSHQEVPLKHRGRHHG